MHPVAGVGRASAPCLPGTLHSNQGLSGDDASLQGLPGTLTVGTRGPDVFALLLYDQQHVRVALWGTWAPVVSLPVHGPWRAVQSG